MPVSLECIQLVRILVRAEADLIPAPSILISAVARNKGIINIKPVAVRFVVNGLAVIDHKIAAVTESEMLDALGALLIILADYKWDVFILGGAVLRRNGIDRLALESVSRSCESKRN